MANPNIVSTSMIYGKTDVMNVTQSPTSITTNSGASGKILKINLLVISNIDGDSPVDVNVTLRRSTTDYYIVKTLSVPADASVVVVSKENTLYLIEGDTIRVWAGAASAAQAICSYEEIG